MIRKILAYLFRLRRGADVPAAPRGLAEHYTSIDGAARRVLERVGARSPLSVGLALRRAKVGSVDELVEKLTYAPPRPPVRERWRALVQRALGVSPDPHRAAIAKAFKKSRLSKSKMQLDKVIRRFK